MTARIHFVLVVWGDEYGRLFVDTTLPNYLSLGNLGSLKSRRVEAEFKIYTTRDDAERFGSAPSLRALGNVVNVRFEFLDDIDRSNKHGAMAESHRRAVVDANRVEAMIMFLAPDVLCSDGTFAHAIDAASNGKRAVMVAGLRAVKETCLPWLRERYQAHGEVILTVSGRDLVKGALTHLHPHSEWLVWGSSAYPRWACAAYFPVGDEGFVGRCFHLHPLLLNPRRRNVVPMGTVDDEYVALTGLRDDEFHVITDSDDGFVCDLSRRDQFGDPVPGRASAERIAAWASRHASAAHLGYARHPILFHVGDVDGKWQTAVRQSDLVVESVMRMVEAKGLGKAWARARWAVADPRTEGRRWAVALCGEQNVGALLRLARRLDVRRPVRSRSEEGSSI
jgi:hypothetical protein